MEADILLWIQEYVRADWLTPFMKILTTLGNVGILWIILGTLLLCMAKTRRIGATVWLSLVFSGIVNNIILKNVVGRVRPYEVIDGLKLLVGKANDASFPSGHSAASFAAAVVLAGFLPKKYGIPALIVAGGIAFSRLYVGIHYPTDVLAGIADGILLGLLAVKWNPFKAEKIQ